jgi:biopolymer transport protein TolR
MDAPPMRRRRAAMSQINVVPYIDVMLVLLIIFMVAAPMLPTGNVELPSLGEAAQTPEKPIQITVNADQSLVLMDRANQFEQPVTLAELPARIAALRDAGGNRPVVIAGDKSVRYGSVLQVMDALQRQNIARIGLLVQPTGK